MRDKIYRFFYSVAEPVAALFILVFILLLAWGIGVLIQEDANQRHECRVECSPGDHALRNDGCWCFPKYEKAYKIELNTLGEATSQ